MTVTELIHLLQQQPDEAEVTLIGDDRDFGPMSAITGVYLDDEGRVVIVGTDLL